MSLEVSSLRALAHPTRLRMLSLLTGAQLSATEVAAELGISQANASYHLRQLLRAGQLEVAEKRAIRGGVATIYRHPWNEAPAGEGLADPEGSRLFVRALANELTRRESQRLPGERGTFTDAELWVQPQEWEAARDQVDAASHRLHAAAGPPRSDGTVRVSMTTALFRMQDQEQP